MKNVAATVDTAETTDVAEDGGRSMALALAYAPGDMAPRVVAKGRGLIADEIIRRAREAGVFVHESRELVTLLMQSNLDDHIPAELYVAIAELLAWIYRLEQEGKTTPSSSS
ncbi:MAG: EscU/YscU/HrcU family type III secretion system export apparatus switch protein [Sterolibacterium sp.]|nr:EscU/YscU/HrcU family type III secretion system export apparatus switch protein [Sterolibacterium sp.]MBP9798895.1 EscU/YscU/HrcU family type III secretion system export apparatus switch protein [Sterolibacterium sp.]